LVEFLMAAGLNLESWPAELRYNTGQLLNGVQIVLRHGWQYLAYHNYDMGDPTLLIKNESGHINLHDLLDLMIRYYLMMWSSDECPMAQAIGNAYFNQLPEGEIMINDVLVKRSTVKSAAMLMKRMLAPLPLEKSIKASLFTLYDELPTAENADEVFMKVLENPALHNAVQGNIGVDVFHQFFETDFETLQKFLEFLQLDAEKYYHPFRRLNLSWEQLQLIAEGWPEFEKKYILPHVSCEKRYIFLKKLFALILRRFISEVHESDNPQDPRLVPGQLILIIEG